MGYQGHSLQSDLENAGHGIHVKLNMHLEHDGIYSYDAE